MDQYMKPENRKPMERVLYEVKKVIVGQDQLLERLVVALLARGHILVEGVPGLAKTMAIKTLAHPIHARPGPRRSGRHPHLQSKDGGIQHLARPGLYQSPAGGRNQSRPGQGAKRLA